MFRSLVLAAVALATATNALYFKVSPVAATDNFYLQADHTVDFVVNAPDNVSEQGGSDARECVLRWNGTEPATCYQPCGGALYWARITPGGYDNAGCFKLDLWQAYVDEIGAHNTATVWILQGENNYTCADNGFCQMPESSAFNVTLTENYGLSEPDDSVGGACFYP